MKELLLTKNEYHSTLYLYKDGEISTRYSIKPIECELRLPKWIKTLLIDGNDVVVVAIDKDNDGHIKVRGRKTNEKDYSIDFAYVSNVDKFFKRYRKRFSNGVVVKEWDEEYTPSNYDKFIEEFNALKEQITTEIREENGIAYEYSTMVLINNGWGMKFDENGDLVYKLTISTPMFVNSWRLDHEVMPDDVSAHEFHDALGTWD